MTNISIDSFKLRIPLEKANIINQSLQGKWLKIHEYTGEIDLFDKSAKNCLTKKYDGITTRYAIEDQVGAKGKVITYLTMLINSKLLMSEYFEGIHEGNIRKVYDEIMKHEIVSIKYDDFINYSYVTDVDIKKDIITKNIVKYIPVLKDLTRPTKAKGKGCLDFVSETNVGIEWSDRRNRSTGTSPYIKIYHKGLELKHKSNIFANAYLSKQEYEYKVRLETTIKNAKHFSKYGVKNTLKDVLAMSQDTMAEVFTNAIQCHLEPRVRIIDNSKLKLMDRKELQYIVLLIEKGMCYDSIVNYMVQITTNRTERKRIRDKIITLYTTHIKGTNMDKKPSDQESFFSWLGI